MRALLILIVLLLLFGSTWMPWLNRFFSRFREDENDPDDE